MPRRLPHEFVWHAILLPMLSAITFQDPNFFAMKTLASLAAGLAGTVTVASLHEALKRVTPNAPRMDELDMELIRKGLQRIKVETPERGDLQRWAVAGELVCDTTYFGLVALGKKKGAWMRGAALGLVAGLSTL